MAKVWFCLIDEREYGPLEAEKLVKLVRTGRVTEATPVRKGQNGAWVAANRVRGLFPAKTVLPSRDSCHVQPGASLASAESDAKHDRPPRFDESAASTLPKDESSWQRLVLAAHHETQYERAVELAKQALHEYPRSGWLWRQLGSELTAVDRLDEAEKALDKARSLLGWSDEWLWRFFAALYRKRKDVDKEIASLETLHELAKENSADLTYLGIAYHNKKYFAKALEYYRFSAQTEQNVYAFFNMGLVYNDPELSQDADAADAYCRALRIQPDYQLAKERLETAKKKLIPLAERALAAAVKLIQSDEVYDFYLSPFEILQIQAIESPEQLDVKVIQRAKKRLLQEIELNDGKVNWLNDYLLDKSRALALVEELHSDAKLSYHSAIFKNKRLLRFLTHGDISHFSYSDDYSPHEVLQLLDDDPEFLEFLSKPFARQYNRVLSRAIERRLFPVVEVLFDGRRWVEPADDDICFEGAYKQINGLLEKLRSKADDGHTRILSLREMEDFLREHSFVELFNLLPTAFATAQKECVTEIRSLAIDCFNEHDDADLSKSILSLCKRFTSRSVELSKLLEKDFNQIEKMIAEEKKHSFSALVNAGQRVDVSKDHIKFAGAAVRSQDVEAIRWGTYVRTVNGLKTEHSFSLFVRGTRSTVEVAWGIRGVFAATKSLFRKPGVIVPITELSSSEQEVYFQKLIDAVIHHLLPPLVTKQLQRLQASRPLVIGPCTLSAVGVTFRSGFIFQKDYLLPWQDVDTQAHNGQIHVFSRQNPKLSTSMPAKDTDNAVVLPILCNAMRDYSN